MSIPFPTPGAQPVEESPFEDAGEQPQATDEMAIIGSLDQEALSRLLGYAADDEENDEYPDSEDLSGMPGADPDEEPSPDGAWPQDGAFPPALKPIQRLSVRSLPADEQHQLASAVDMVRNGHAANVYQALQIIAGPQTGDASQADSTATGDPFNAAPSPDITGIEAHLASLREQRERADEDYDRTQVRRLTAEIEQAVIQLAQTRAEDLLQQQEAAGYQRAYVDAMDAMERKYPETQDASSLFYHLLDDKVIAAQSRNDPALHDPAFIMRFADEVAGLLRGGVRPPPPPSRSTRPAGGHVAPGHSQAAKLTRDQGEHAIHHASQEELGAALWR